jgi:hypothetical protein
MKRFIQFAVAVALFSALAATMQPAQAVCANLRGLTSLPGYVFTPGNQFYPSCGYPDPVNYPCGGDTTYHVNGWFWSFGAGNPVVGAGNDNGSNKGQYPSNWLQVGYYPGSQGGAVGTFIGGGFSHWNFAGTDGCIDNDGTNPVNPDPAQCNVVVLEDFTGPNGAYVVLASDPDAGGNYSYNTDNGFPPALNLALVPKPLFGPTNQAPGGVNVNVSLNCGPLTPANGYYLQCPGTPNFPGSLQAGYRLYHTIGPAGTKPTCADSRVVSPGGTGAFPCSGAKQWQPLGGPLACGQGLTNQFIPCTDDQDVYVCATLLFGGNMVGASPWEMKYCSMNSSPLECGPTSADPKPKPGLGTRERRVERGTR